MQSTKLKQLQQNFRIGCHPNRQFIRSLAINGADDMSAAEKRNSEQAGRPVCRNCGKVSEAVQRLLNPTTGIAERMFQCSQCRTVNWIEPA